MTGGDFWFTMVVGFSFIPMPRKVAREDHRTLTVELPLSEFEALEQFCLQRQETKRQVIRTLIRNAVKKVADV
jgi:hypothetical protein